MKRRSNLSVLRELLDIAMHRTDLSAHLRLVPPRRPYGTMEPTRYVSHWYWQDAARDVWRLKVLHDHDDGIHESINKRAALKAHIDKCAVGGMIGIVESGRDCDCVEYVHPRSAIPATLAAFYTLERDTGKWADGPFNLSIVSPQQAEETEHESRDLALEAFEDGHPHHITSRYP